MKLSNKYFKLAMVGAVVLGFAVSSGPAWAQFDPQNPRTAAAETWEAGDPEEIGVFAEVNNSFDVDVTDLHFGEIGATASTGEEGELTIAPDGTTTPAPDGGARIVEGDDADLTQAILDITGAFDETDIYLDFSNINDLTCVDAGCMGSPDLLLVDLISDQDTAARWNADNAGLNAQGVDDTSAAGALEINIGATIRTADTNDAYLSGMYVGSFEVTVSY